MKKELQDKLFEKYPKIFKQKDLDMKSTCMCWGIECGDGWYDLIDKLCKCIQTYVDCNQKDQVEASQVKEKYGELRFYVDHSNPMVDGMIWFAEHLSVTICEACGSTNNVKATEGWITHLCEDCYRKKN